MRLADIPHKRLTRPARVFDLRFAGQRKPQARDAMVRLDTVAAGTLNAVVYWFDLHLDERSSLCSGALLAEPRRCRVCCNARRRAALHAKQWMCALILMGV